MANVADRLRYWARLRPDSVAVAVPRGRDQNGHREYAQLTFRQLDERSNALAAGLGEWGVPRGARLALLVRPSLEFYELVFALLKAEMLMILIDPGMGRRSLIGCLTEAEPDGFIAIPAVHWVRRCLKSRFARARWNVVVGRPWLTGARPLARLYSTNAPNNDMATDQADSLPDGKQSLARDDTPAAIIFTTGSTGPPKGVLYTQGTFDNQTAQIQAHYQIQPGEVDLPGFPLFGLFNAAMGVTTVVPDMDPRRPARVDPDRIVEAVRDWKVTQAFGSPAMWNRVAPACNERGIRLSTLKRVLTAGAPAPPRVLAAVRECIASDGEAYTPYGATEALPVASISSREVLGETAAESRLGRGTCVGRRFQGISWRIIEIVDGPIATLDATKRLPPNNIGELIVAGAVVTQRYVTRVDANELAKIADGDQVWHRMGDVGYLDDQDRFWFCGRLAHRVTTSGGTLYTIPCEAIFNEHPAVFRAALVGVGERGIQRPAIVVEPWPSQYPRGRATRKKLFDELRLLGQQHVHTRSICDFLVIRAMPVDIRHNAKIFRERLAAWAARYLSPSTENVRPE